MKRYYALLTLALVGGVASARQISESEAKAIAQTKLPGIGTTMARIQQKGQAAADAPLYIFNSPKGGFAIVAGDDRMPNMVLAYSDNAEFDLDNCSPAVRAWLDEVSRFIAAGEFAGLSRLSVDYSTPVAPLITTKWNQEEPYNLMTPLGSEGTHCPTGCAATAMAQIVNYWEYPKEGGLAEHSYEWNGQTLSVDFRESRYDWANMADVYDETSTDAQKEAVAKLMLDCGVACDMNYGDEMSGAYPANAALGLADYLGYNHGLRMRFRNTTPSDEWAALLKNELDGSRPVFFTAATANNEGHAFVCDGYDESGLFHINWGWGGISDGYFDLTTLDPDTQGTGGASSGQGFSEQQVILTDLRPAQSGDEAAYGWELQVDKFDIDILDEEAENFSIDLQIGNYGYRAFEGDILIYLAQEGGSEEAEGDVLAEISGDDIIKPDESFSISTGELCAADLEDGIYIFNFVAVNAGDTREEAILPLVIAPPMRFEITDGKVICDLRPHLAVSDIELDEFGFYYTIGNAVRGMVANLSFTVTNTSDVWFIDGLKVGTKYVNGVFSEFNNEISYLRDISYIGPGESLRVTLPVQYNVNGRVSISIDSTNRSAQEGQEVVMSDNEFEFESEEFYHEMELTATPTFEGDADASRIIAEMMSCTGSVSISGGPVADLEEVTEKDVVCTVYNTKSDELAASAVATYSGKWHETQMLAFNLDRVLAPGDYTAEFTYKSTPDIFGKALDLTMGEEVEGYEPFSFTVSAETGIADMAADSNPLATEIYTVSGIRVDNGRSLAPGVYLVRQGTKTTKIIVK